VRLYSTSSDMHSGGSQPQSIHVSCGPYLSERFSRAAEHSSLHLQHSVEMPVTFGSVGDIIAVALLVKDLVEALDRCRGSQAEYRQLIQELRLLEDVLRKVDHLCNTSGTSGASFETVALHQTALKITDSCRNLIQAFSARLVKYDKALGDNTQRKNVIKSAIAKIHWQVGEKEDVVRFRAEIAARTTSLSVLLGAKTW